MTEPQAVNLLWTGGWDSTFRLLELLFDEQCPVQPWYLVDEERKSTDYELEAMRAIGEAIRARDEGAFHRLRPVRSVPLDSVAPNAELSKLWGGVRLGSQYDWLARFASQHEVEHLELSIEKRDSRAFGMLWPNVERVEGRGGATYRLVEHPDNPNLELFRPFDFPILNRTKADLQAHADAHGWDGLMALTWFCHSPRGGKPCGSCTPCLVALKEGMGNRIPHLRRFRPQLRRLKRALTAKP